MVSLLLLDGRKTVAQPHLLPSIPNHPSSQSSIHSANTTIPQIFIFKSMDCAHRQRHSHYHYTQLCSSVFWDLLPHRPFIHFSTIQCEGVGSEDRHGKGGVTKAIKWSNELSFFTLSRCHSHCLLRKAFFRSVFINNKSRAKGLMADVTFESDAKSSVLKLFHCSVQFHGYLWMVWLFGACY